MHYLKVKKILTTTNQQGKRNNSTQYAKKGQIPKAPLPP